MISETKKDAVCQLINYCVLSRSLMNHIDKFLKKLTPKPREILREIIARIVANDLSGLDCKKLEGSSHLYRVRKGSMRIKFEKTDHGNEVFFLGFRNDNTYR